MKHVHISDDQIEESSDLKSLTEELFLAFEDLYTNEAATTIRTRATIGKTAASSMSALYPRRNVGGGKLYVYSPRGRSFVIALFSLDGDLLATFDGEALTAERTAAATAIAIRRMASPDSRIGAILGTGRQAIWQIKAMNQEMRLEVLRVAGRNMQKVEEVVGWCLDHGINAVATDFSSAVDEADVIVAVTATYEPLFDGETLKEGSLVCGVGSTTSLRRELDGRTVERASLVVTDSIEGSLIEAGDLIQAAAEGLFAFEDLVSIEELVSKKDFVIPSNGIRLFESQGVALEDVVGAWEIMRRLELL
jgi:ornithine cyclodeaminase